VKRLWLFAPAVVLALILVTSISAAKIGPGVPTGTAQVFVPNPVQSLGNESLTDQKDSDAAVPATAYFKVRLTNLDGSGFLRGDWANVSSETGNPAFSPTNTFVYTRSQDEFEQVMAYYWITESQKYIQSLGFGTKYPPVNKESQDVRINQLGTTTRSRRTIRRTRSATARAVSTTPRMPKSCCTSTGTRSTTARGSSSAARRLERSARASATTGASTWATSSLIASVCPSA